MEESGTPEEKKTEVPPPPKPVVKKDFIPDENFSWDLDLNATYGTNKKKAQENGFIPVVIRSEPS